MILPAVILGIILVVMVFPTVYIFYIVLSDFVRKFRKAYREVIEEHPEWIQKAKEEERREQEEKQRIGSIAFYQQKVQIFLKIYAVEMLIVLAMIGFIGLFIWRYFGAQSVVTIPKHNSFVSVLFLVAFLIVSIVSVCSKNKKVQWIASVVWVFLLALDILWDVSTGQFPRHSRYMGLYLFVIPWVFQCYFKWEQHCQGKFEELQKQLQVYETIHDDLEQRYSKLQEQRHDEKKHLSVLQTLKLENEIEAMQVYLKQLEEQQKEEAHHEEK